MASSQSQARNIERDQVDAARAALRELARLKNNRVSSVSPGTELGKSKESGIPTVGIASASSVNVGRLADDFQNSQAVSRRPSVFGRSLRMVVEGLVAVVIVGAVLTCQWSDDDAKQNMKTWISSLPGPAFIAAINSPDPNESLHDAVVSSEVTSNRKDQGLAQTGVGVPSAPSAPVPAAVEASSELQQKLATISSDLVTVRGILEQLVAGQGRMAQDIATLQTVQQAVNQKISSLNLTPRVPARKNASTSVRSGTLVDQNSEAVTTAPPQAPLELH